jgi:hypothetical protein
MQNRSPLTNVTISDELTLLTDEDQTGIPGDDNSTSQPTTATATPPSASAAADRVGSHLTSSIHPRSSASVGQLKGAFEFEVWCACGGRAADGVGRSASKHARCMPSLMLRLCVRARACARACVFAHACGSRINQHLSLQTPSHAIRLTCTQISVARAAAEASRESMGYSTAPEGHSSVLSSATAATEMPSDDEDLPFGRYGTANTPMDGNRQERWRGWEGRERGGERESFTWIHLPVTPTCTQTQTQLDTQHGHKTHTHTNTHTLTHTHTHTPALALLSLEP